MCKLRIKLKFFLKVPFWLVENNKWKTGKLNRNLILNANFYIDDSECFEYKNKLMNEWKIWKCVLDILI